MRSSSATRAKPTCRPCRGIYAHYVLSSLATFEETPPSLDVMLARRRVCRRRRLALSRGGAEGEVVGFAYAGAYHARPRLSLHGRGFGLCRRGACAAAASGPRCSAALIERCEAGPWRQMIAVVGDSANAGSIASAPAIRLRTGRACCNRSATNSAAGSIRRSFSGPWERAIARRRPRLSVTEPEGRSPRRWRGR